MYRITVKNGNTITIIHDPSSLKFAYDKKVTKELNMSDLLTFTIDNTFDKTLIKKYSSIITVYDDNDILFQGRCINDEVDLYNNSTIECEGALSYLYDTQYPPYEFTGTPKDMFVDLINNHNNSVEENKKFEIGNVTVTDPNDYLPRSSKNYSRTLDVIKSKLITSLGGYINVRYGDKNTIDYIESLNHIATQKIEITKNLIDINIKTDESDIITVLIPFGKTDDETGTSIDITSVNGGKNYIENKNAIEKYGRIYGTVKFEDVTVPSNLLKKAESYLLEKSSPQITITLTAVDLHMVDSSIEKFKLGDWIKVVIPTHSIDEYFLLSKIEYDLDNPENSKITLGTIESGLTDTNTTIIESVSEMNNQVISNLVAVNAKITGKLDVNIFEAFKAEIDDLDVINLTARVATIETSYVDKQYVTENYVGIQYANQTYAVKSEVGNLSVDIAKINTLLSGSVSAGSTQTIVLNAENTTIANALIKSANIESLDFNKMTGVDINTTKLTVHSNDGLSTWKDNTILIKDSVRNRVQIGRDAQGDYNIYIWDKDGKVMFDPLGLTEDGVNREIIDNSNVKENAAISGSKLDIDSVVTEINGSTTTINSNKIYFDDRKQTLDVAFSSIKTTVEDHTSKIQTNTTSISTANGKISTLITDVTQAKTDISDAQGSISTLTNNYSSVKQTVDGLSSTVGSHTSSISNIQTTANNALSTANSFSNKITEIQQNLDGFKTTVSNTYATKTQLNEVDGKFSDYSTTTEMNSAINQKADEITTRVTSVETNVSNLNSGINEVTTRLETAEQKITDTAIISTVRNSTSYQTDLNKKVNSTDIISTINQTAESIKIQASKIELTGSITIGMLDNSTANKINGSLKRLQYTIDLSSSTYNVNTYYPVVGASGMPTNELHKFECHVHLNSGTKPSWATHNSGFSVNLIAYAKSNGWGTTNGNGWIEENYYGHCDKMPAYFQQMSYTSKPVFYLRGGGKYFIYTDYETSWNIYTSRYDTNQSTTYPQYVEPTTSPSNSYTIMEPSNIGSWCASQNRTMINGGKIYTGSITADKINVTTLSAITANLGNVTAGNITSNTTINVTTDLKVGNNIYLNQPANSIKYIYFNSNNYIQNMYSGGINYIKMQSNFRTAIMAGNAQVAVTGDTYGETMVDIRSSDRIYLVAEGTGYIDLSSYSGGLGFYSNGHKFYFEGANGGNALALRPQGDDNGTIALGQSWARWGTLFTKYNPNVASDRRLKKEVQKFDIRYERMFMELNPVRYILKDEMIGYHTGFIAQEVEESLLKNSLKKEDFKGLCKEYNKNINDYEYSLAYGEFVSLNTHMIQKNITKLSKHDEEIQNLKNENKHLSQELETTKSKLEAFINGNFELNTVTREVA
ncbi:phage tail spike protein [Coprobacillus cateniformis]|uniref:phage tail spike protein n=1 Tax=Coprobacillus cateniformis TaxID=100884 RepID=UPI0039A34E2F